MNKITKKSKSLGTRVLLVLLCALLLLSGCGTAPASVVSSSAPSAASAASAASASAAGTHAVVDTIGQTVEVPNQIDRIVIISTMPLASVYTMVVGSAEKLVGLTPDSKNAAVHSFLIRFAPEIANVSTDFAAGDEPNVEEVVKLDPDVVFYNTNAEEDAAACQKLLQLGVPCVGFSTTIDDNNTVETFNTWAELIGSVMQEEVKAKEITDYGRKVQAMVKERVDAIPEDQRGSALILANYTPNAIVAAGSTFGRYWTSAIGAEDVASSIDQAVSPVALEDIYAWDPDVIFLNSFSAYTADDILNSTAVEGQDWSGLSAVKNGRVYKYPLGVYYWFPPCFDSPLALEWMATKMYPEAFADIDMDQEIKDYYEKFYGLTLTDEDLATLYNPPADSAMVY